MSASKDGSSPPNLLRRTPAENCRLVWRGITAALIFLGMFGVFVAARGVDFLLGLVADRPITALASKTVSAWARRSLPLLGLRLTIIGTPTKSACVFVANHASWIDIIALQAAAAPSLVAKAEVRNWPLIGFVGQAIGTLFIDRRPVSAKRQETELLTRLASGQRMALFPEGTSSNGRLVLPFKSTLFAVFQSPELRESVRVQPVAIRYRPDDHLPTDFYAWWGDAEFGPHLVDVLARSQGGKVVVSFLEPMAADDTLDRKDLARIAEAAVRTEFDRLI